MASGDALVRQGRRHTQPNKGLHPTHAVGRPLRGLPRARAAEAPAVGWAGRPCLWVVARSASLRQVRLWTTAMFLLASFWRTEASSESAAFELVTGGSLVPSLSRSSLCPPMGILETSRRGRALGPGACVRGPSVDWHHRDRHLSMDGIVAALRESRRLRKTRSSRRAWTRPQRSRASAYGARPASYGAAHPSRLRARPHPLPLTSIVANTSRTTCNHATLRQVAAPQQDSFFPWCKFGRICRNFFVPAVTTTSTPSTAEWPPRHRRIPLWPRPYALSASPNNPAAFFWNFLGLG